MMILIAFIIIAAATVYCCIRFGSRSDKEEITHQGDDVN